MTVVSFTDRSFRIAPTAGGGDEVVLTTLVSAADAKALVAALAWLRARDHLAPALESADDVLALRALVALIDQLDEIGDSAPGAPVTLGGAPLRLLAEGVARYRAERDGDAYVAPSERDRIVRLRAVGDRLFDAVADLAGAEAEARALTRRP
jgi:hypothetical protein